MPVLQMGSVRAQGKQAITNDEVAAMLQALQLNKGFFDDRLRRDKSLSLEEVDGSDSLPAQPMVQHSFTEDLKRARSRMAKKLSEKTSGSLDFDIYLNEALMPVLAQSLDSLCRQVSRMDEQGDRLDPKVRARFNPLTFLAQQLLRRHPKCAKTPRRQALYQNFHQWADHERGRREMLRRKEEVMEVFSGFVLRGVVQMEDIPKVLKAIDDTMHLEGQLMNHSVMVKDFGARARVSNLNSMGNIAATASNVGGSSPGGSGLRKSARNPRARASFFDKSTGVSWQRFWTTFSNIVMSHDVVTFTALKRGDELAKEEHEEKVLRTEAEERLAQARAQREEEYRQQMTAYEELYGRLCDDEKLNLILQEDKILTGDDVRPRDAGYEFEVAPKGRHVSMLQELLVLFGLFEPKQDSTENEENWWTSDLANSWIILQEMHRAELADGVVEREVLEQVLVPPAGFMALKLKIADELERRAEAKGEMEHLKMDDLRIPARVSTGVKPSYERLCERTGMTVGRIQWLHSLFESYMDPDPANPDELPFDNYPDDPGCIAKQRMKELILEVQPELGESEFEARFKRIDQDNSGVVEFDEFVTWVHADEVRVVGDSNKKMTFEELAAHHEESLDVIMYLHTCFQDALPEGQVDRYPDEAAPLAEEELKNLVRILTPNVTEDDINQSFDTIDVDRKGRLDFDEFLEVLNMDELPQDLREKYST